jgi:hypothetical protein
MNDDLESLAQTIYPTMAEPDAAAGPAAQTTTAPAAAPAPAPTAPRAPTAMDVPPGASVAAGAPAAAPADGQAAERAAPEAYELKAPEGVTLDAEARSEFEAVARELNMPQAEAQALVERMAPKLQQRFVAQQAETVARVSAEWAEAAKADKEIGGDALPQNLAAARRAVKQFGSPELSALLEDSRLGNHPEVLRFLARAGRALGEDGTFLAGRAPGHRGATPAQSIYAASNMNP